MTVRSLCAIAAVAGTAASASALTFECRWVERVGTVDTVIGGNGATLDLSDGLPARIRLQYRVVDDAMGPAPLGGFVGWNVGTIAISGDPSNSADRRTNGRIGPFNFAAQPTANGNPPPAGGVNTGDAVGTDFQGWSEIDATLGTQAFAWTCNPDGTVPPQPSPLIRGRNSFVSVWEMTTDPSATGTNYSITTGGNLIAATEWRPVGTPQEPDCTDPDNPVPGSVTYAPFPTNPTAFSCTLNILVPAPGAAALLGLGGLLAARRRR
jgi:hypothetical protein